MLLHVSTESRLPANKPAGQQASKRASQPASQPASLIVFGLIVFAVLLNVIKCNKQDEGESNTISSKSIKFNNS